MSNIMKLKLEIHEKTIGREFRRFLELTEEERWRRKIEKFNTRPRLSELNVLGDYLAAKNPLIPAIDEYLRLERQGKSIWRYRTPGMLRVVGYIVLVNRLAHELGDGSLKRIKGLLFDDSNARPFLFELDIAAHFLRQGYNVIFVDLAGLGEYDLLIQGEHELEVECKRKSADAGRRITRRDFYLLSDILFSHLSDVKGQYIVTITCSDRLSSDETTFRKLAKRIANSLNANFGEDSMDNMGFSIDRLTSNLTIKTDQEAAAVLSAYSSGSEHFTVFSRQETTFVIKCGSVQEDNVLTAIYEGAKEAATQLSGSQAGLIACFIEDVEEHDWSALQEGSGLSAIAKRLFESQDRLHVRFVTFSSDYRPIRQAHNAVSFAATNLTFENAKARYPVPRTFIRMRH